MDSIPLDVHASWNDRLFARLPISPYAAAAAAGLGLVAVFLAIVWATGDLAAFLERDDRWWEERDARLAIVLAVLAAYLPAARTQQNRSTARHVAALGPVMGWDDAALGDARARVLRGGPRAAAAAGLVAVALVPVTAVLVDRDPGLYLQRHYWSAGQFWSWGLGAFVTWNLGRLFHAIVSQGRRFSKLAHDLPEIDLLALDRLEPFARQGVRSALVPMVILSLMSLNVVDRGFLWALGVLGAIGLAFATAGMWLPTRGLRGRIAETRSSELVRVGAAIRGAPGALEGSLLSRRDPPPSLADLLQYRSFVESVPAWGMGAPVRNRLLLYVALPIGSWLGGALVERVLNVALG